jgi:UDP-N-acetylglucosamine 2-epimerase (non-hydrolysing)
MTDLRVLTIFGTRPEAVKMAPVIKALEQTEGIQSIVLVTAQHRQMLDQVLEIFDIIPDIDLNLMRPDQSLADLTAAIFTNLDPILSDIKPDWVLVQGDTTTVMAAALLSYYRRIQVGHVEAGLRTYDKWQPFPEEINRRVAGVVADLHFAPTEWSRQNLLKENIPSERILVTGNTVIDALHYVVERPPTPEVEALYQRLDLCESYQQTSFEKKVQINQRRLVVVTAHRRENFGPPFEQICFALRELAEFYGDQIHIVYPVHLNPNVQEPVNRLLKEIANVTLLPPLDYLPMMHLLKRADLLLTDSGGLQEEAPSLGIPVLVLREVTERPEGVQAGTVRLVGTDKQRIVSESRRILDNPEEHMVMARAVNPYGDGQAAGRIVNGILSSKAQSG